MDKKKTIKIVVMMLFTLLVFSLGASYAYFISRINQEGQGSNVDGSTASNEDTVVSTTGSIGFTDTNFYPEHKNISKIVLTATGGSHVIYNLIWTGTNSLNTTLKYSVYKTTTEEFPTITCTKKEKGLVRKELYEECEENLTNLGEVIKTGKIKPSEASETIKLVKNEEIDASNAGAKVYYYIVLEYPNEDVDQSLDMNGSFTGNINVELLDKRENVSSDLISNNDMVQEKFTSDSGEIVDAGYRYQGSNPNNYVRFNNELWRIIGVFDVETASGQTESLVKLIRNEHIKDSIAWDTNASNDWTQSDLKTILNEQYYNGEDINYTYRNPDNSLINSNPTVTITGISINDTARSMIENVNWHIGGSSSATQTSSALYMQERGTIGSGANQSVTRWNGYIGLMYPSDYGYAVDSTSCSRTTMLDSYNLCHTNSWLYNNTLQWTMTSNSEASIRIFGVNRDGNTEIVGRVAEGYGVRPSLYLKSNIFLVKNGNDGSIDHPYELTFGY